MARRPFGRQELRDDESNAHRLPRARTAVAPEAPAIAGRTLALSGCVRASSSTDSYRVSKLADRLMVAAIALPIVVVVIASGARASSCLFATAAGISCWEYLRLTLRRLGVSGWTGVAAATVLPLLPAVLAAPIVGGALFVVVAAASMLVWTIELWSSQREAAPTRVGHIVAAILFCSVGMVALSALRVGPDGATWVAFVLVATWANDTVAYFVGRALGEHKLWPAVSPKKTWEGLAAGFWGGIVGLLLMRRWLPPQISDAFCLVAGVVAGVVAPVGDLCKSMLKRAYHVKDMGKLLPGHGGVLDRIDAVLFVAPLIWVLRSLAFRH
jgi:phosphatidate cytidylyltransferase